MSKRILLAVLGGVLVFAVVAASAASLNGITSTKLGADDGTVASCDTNGVTTAYTNTYTVTGTPGFKVGNVTVGAIDDVCDGQSMTVTLSDASNASLGSVTQAVPAVASTFTNVLDFSAQSILSENVTGIHVVITG